MPGESEFTAAQERLKKLSRRPSNDQLLKVYGLYKQATEGDLHGNRPGILDPKGRAKFDAWAACKGLAPAEAKARYVTLVDELVRSHG